MFKSLIAFCLSRRPIVVLGLVLFAGAGFIAFKMLNIEAYPNPTPVILEITAQAPGLSAEEMERYYTIPMEIGLYTTPGIDVIRSTSFYGLVLCSRQLQIRGGLLFCLRPGGDGACSRTSACRAARCPPSRPTAQPAKSIATRSWARRISESSTCAPCRIGSWRGGC